MLAGGCGGGGGPDTTAAPVANSTPTTATQPTQPVKTTPARTQTGKAKPVTTPKKPAIPVVREVACGKIYFSGLGRDVPVSAAGVPCGSALSYAKRFVSTDQPSQKNLPAGWKLGDCTGINDAPPTPGEPNSPRCSSGQRAFTIHFPQD
ncbi:MAG: hypothetical protein QOG09_1139 [Solirubrobacterales bacterium]|nr:hypothetical protein [Solirubrobacterales bacterium]